MLSPRIRRRAAQTKCIDHQFAGPEWQVLGCRVHQEIKWSDHYPVEALYQLTVNSE